MQDELTLTPAEGSENSISGNTGGARKKITRWHHISGITMAVFIGFHLLNHLISLFGPDSYGRVMDLFRRVYRFPPVEYLILAAAFSQIVTGIRLLFGAGRKTKVETLQYYSGIYLSFFLLFHIAAVLLGRYQGLDTNFYFAAAGLNDQPSTIYFIPYYFLAVTAIFMHVASIHYIKTHSKSGSLCIALTGITISVLILLGFTQFFHWRTVPLSYQYFIRNFFRSR